MKDPSRGVEGLTLNIMWLVAAVTGFRLIPP
jgi:hypothetical protein